MKRLKTLLFLLVLASAGVAAYVYMGRPPTELVLTGIVTTNDLIVSPQIGGRISDLKVVEGDVVKKDQLVAVIAPDELRADTAYYAHSAEGMVSQVRESEAALRLQERQTADQIKQAEANLAAAEAQQMAAVADLENAKLERDRSRNLSQKGVEPPQRYDTARTANDQRSKAEVRLGYADVRAPIDGIVDVRAMRVGEVINPGETIVTLINPDDLWIRADVEETYIDRVRLGDKMTLRLPSGEERQGTVIFRGVDAGFATQRDVSRTKRDIKTFEVRLRADNADRRLAVGMTAYVLLPVHTQPH